MNINPIYSKKHRLIFSCLTAVLFIFLVSCRVISSSSPSYVASKIGAALIEGDMETVLSHIDFDNNLSITLKGISLSMPLKIELKKESMDLPFKKFKILSEKISNDGNTAVVTVKTIFKDRTSTITDTNFIKTDDGWKAIFAMEQ